MKICIFCPNFKSGGAQKNSINLSSYFSKINHEVTLLVLNDEGPLKNQLNKNVKILNLKTNRISISIYRILKILNHYEFDVIISMIQETNIILGISSLFTKNKSLLIGREANTLNKVINLNFIKRITYLLILKYSYYQLGAIVSNSFDT